MNKPKSLISVEVPRQVPTISPRSTASEALFINHLRINQLNTPTQIVDRALANTKIKNNAAVAAIKPQPAFTETQLGGSIADAPAPRSCPCCANSSPSIEQNEVSKEHGDVLFTALCVQGPAGKSQIEACEAWNRRAGSGEISMVGGFSGSALVFEDRLDAQRMRIFQALSIVGTVAKVIDETYEPGDELQEQPLWWSLVAAKEMLDDIAAKLDPAELLETPKALSEAHA
jgi:hypothetical protein